VRKIETRICKFCGKEFLGNKLANFCSRICANRHSAPKRSLLLIGKKSWNYGLTKTTDARVAKQNHVNGHAWNYGLKKTVDQKMENFGKLKAKIDKPCETCGTIMHLTLTQYKERRYCKISCRPPWNKGLTKDTNETIHQQSEKMKQMYISGAMDMQKLWVGQTRKPNKHETILDSFLQKFYPNTWEYVGDGSTWMTSHSRHLNPDFRHLKEKKVIEYNGAYFHRKDTPGEREKLYSDIGWKCLIITEDDIFSANGNLIDKLEEFQTK
jgi:hypothetical protein